MAHLIEQQTGFKVYLRNYHSFGRLTGSVSTAIEMNRVSRIHAIIEWLDDHWTIRDLSTNGMWVNGKRLTKNQVHCLKLKDKLSFANLAAANYVVADLQPPQDMLLKLDPKSNAVVETQPLQSYNLLPDEENPELVIHTDPYTKTWYLENPEAGEGSARKITDKDHFTIANNRYRLLSLQPSQHTEQMTMHTTSLSELKFDFAVSQDEESTDLGIEIGGEKIQLETRSHHYLTLLLARVKHQQQAYPPSEQGWIYTEELAKDLGVDVNHLNIMIHRARKQFAEAMSGYLNTNQFLQRKSGKIRFGGERFTIKKGAKQELSFPDKVA